MTASASILAALGWICALLVLGLMRRRLERVARAEHELRGSATALQLACARLRRDPRAAPYGAALEAQLARLYAGMADLTYARAGGRPAPRPALTELRAATGAALAPWEARAPGVGLGWVGGPALASVDRAELAKVLGNLMANAAEHGVGDLRVRGHNTPSGVRIEVRNANPRGAGAGAKERASGAPPGRGRGLRIAEAAARRLGGRLLLDMGERETVAVLELPRAAEGEPEPGA